LLLLSISVDRFELQASPEDCIFGAATKPHWVKQRSLVMVAEDTEIELHRVIDTFERVGAIADNVAEANNFGDILVGDIGQHCLKSFQVAVNITQDRTFHVANPPLLL